LRVYGKNVHAGDTPRIRTASIALVLTTIALLVCAFCAWQAYSSAGAASVRTQAGRVLARRALTTLIDAETGQRGWLATGDNLFLEPYRRAQRDWPDERRALLESDGSLGITRDQLIALLALADERLDELEQNMQSKRAGVSNSQLSWQMLDGKAMMDGVRAALAELDAVSERVANEHERDARRDSLLTVLLLSGAAFAALMLGISSWAARRSYDSRRRAVAERERLRDRFRVLTLATAKAVWTTSADGKNLEDSPSFRQLTGITDEEWRANGVLGVVHPDDLPRVRAVREGAFAQKKPVTVEGRVRQAGGGYRWMQASVAPVIDARGDVVEWIGALTDISERKEYEAERVRLTAQLAALLASAPVGLALVDRDLRYLGVNEALARLNGHAVEEHIGRRVEEVLPSDVVAHVVPILRQVLDSGERVTTEERIKTPDGHDGVFDMTWVPVAGEGGVAGVAVAMVDVTTRVQAQEDREAANRAKDEFLAMLGHELRNPMAPIATALQLIKLKGEQRSSRELEVIERQVGYMLRLVDDLLDISRITKRKIELRKERLTVASAVTKAVEMVMPLFEQRQHRLDVDVAPDLWVDADPVRLAQVLSNVLTNAAKYTDPGGQVRLSAHAEGTQVVLRVADDGIGMTPEVLRRVFEPFVQAPRSIDRAQGGMGIGLSLVRSLVELHGGTVTAHSEGADKGTEVEIRLPAARPEDTLPLRVRAPALGGPVAQPQKILIVDDNADAAELLGELLKAAGHDVRLAYDGPDAMKVSEEFTADLAILDIGLPVMDGYELAGRLRESGHRPPRLIAVSGYGQEQDRVRSREAGFEKHLVKPVDPAALLAAIDGPSP
jgi:PAS domain S-box-containing protein